MFRQIGFAVAGLLCAAPAMAEGPGGGAQTLLASCRSSPISGGGLVNECMGPNANPEVRFQSMGPQFNYSVTFTAPATHCSRIGYHVYSYDLRTPLGASGLLGPGQSQTVSIGNGYAAGLQIAKVKGFGWISATGCNTGTLQSWGATATVAQQ